MSCSPFDLKDYILEELDANERAAVEEHVSACPACRDELNTLNLTRAALLSVPDEEPPHRIAFVSDRVFEPRWWQKLWHSGPQLGFASAAMLSLAVLVHGFVPRVAMQVPVAATQSNAEVEKIVAAEVAKRVDGAVAKAVADSQDRETARTLEVVNERLKVSERQHREDLLLVKEYLERVQKGQQMIRRAAYERDLQ